jgi:transmembrane sensor
VRRDQDSLEVVVIEGKVRVEDAAPALRSDTADASKAAAPDDLNRAVLLVPGTIARTQGPSVLVQHKSLPEIEAHLSWRSGMLMFRDESLADAVAEFNRYNARRIVIADSKVGALRIEGTFRATNVDAFVRLLEAAFPVRATTEAHEITLSSR